MKTLGLSLALSAATLFAIGTGSASAQDADQQFLLELNNAAPTDSGGCRLTYVATNQSSNEMTKTSYQVGIFDAGGVVRSILLLDFGNLPSGKTRIVLFDLAGQSCTDISRIVVDSAVECTLADGSASDFCMTGLSTGSRTDIQFGL